jgi:hypothetical protein
MKKTNPIPVVKPLTMFTLKQVATRPRCLDILSMPSRMGGTLFYPKEI